MSRRIFYFLFSLMLLLVISMFSYSSLALAHNESWTCSADYGTTPTIDGQINPRGEWADANKVTFDAPNEKSRVTVYMKAIPGDYPGGGRLYLCYVIPNALSQASFQWDSSHDLGRTPKVDDRRIIAERSSQEFGGFYFAEGTGTDWKQVADPSGFSGAISPLGQTNWIVEMAIPYSWLRIKICDPSPRGCTFDVSGYDPDGKFVIYYWPPAKVTGTNYMVPATWGNMVPSDCWGSPRGRLVIEKGSASPVDHTWMPGEHKKYNEMIQLMLHEAASESHEDILLKSLTVIAAGTGNERDDIAGTYVFLDPNRNGRVDSGEDLLVSGAYPADNGSITFTFPGKGLLVPDGETVYIVIAYVMKSTAPVGAEYQFYVSDGKAWGVTSNQPVPITGIIKTSVATHLEKPVFLLWSAKKKIENETHGPISLEKNAAAPTVIAGENVTFDIKLTNQNTNWQFSEVQVTDQLPAETSFISAGGGGTYNPGTNTITWNFSNLNPLESKTMNLVLKVAANTPDGTIISNKAVATADNDQPVEAEDKVTVKGGEGPSGPVLSIQKIAAADSVTAGENITYNILVANTSSQTLLQVKVTDKLPPEVSFVSADNGGVHNPGTGVVTWELGTFNPGDWKNLSLVVKVDSSTPDGTIIHNKAVAAALRHQPVESEDEVVVVGNKVHEAFIKGYPDGTFGPNLNVTRGEIVAIIARLLHLEGTVSGTQFYSDVPDTHWTFKYVEAVTRANIMKGLPDGTFRPDQSATRADVAVAMLRAREIDPVVFLPAPPFSDISGHWAIKEIETAYILGIVEGLPDGTFHPNDPIIRSETVTLMCRTLGRGPLLEGSVTRHFPDCTPADWFYGWGEESFETHKGVHMASGNERLIEYVPSSPVW